MNLQSKPRVKGQTWCKACLLFYVPELRIQAAGRDLKHNNTALILAPLQLHSSRCKMKRTNCELYTNIDLPLEET